MQPDEVLKWIVLIAVGLGGALLFGFLGGLLYCFLADVYRYTRIDK